MPGMDIIKNLFYLKNLISLKVFLKDKEKGKIIIFNYCK